jgi:predicted ABC-type ATPase
VSDQAPSITVLAGPNGAGKSSVAGAYLRSLGGSYFNPDEATARLLEIDPTMAPVEANSRAWQVGRELLEQAIADRQHFAFETTLGGNTIPALLQQGSQAGIEVRIWFVALASPELHLARIQSRVSHGGHDIPERKVRERYDNSRINLINLLSHLTDLRVFDNSLDGDPNLGGRPDPQLVLHLRDRRILAPGDLTKAPDWAKPIVAKALQLTRGTSS